MRDLCEVAEQIRAVRQAQRKFLELWAMEQAVVHPGLDRMAADVEKICSGARPIALFDLNEGAGRDDED